MTLFNSNAITGLTFIVIIISAPWECTSGDSYNRHNWVYIHVSTTVAKNKYRFDNLAVSLTFRDRYLVFILKISFSTWKMPRQVNALDFVNDGGTNVSAFLGIFRIEYSHAAPRLESVYQILNCFSSRSESCAWYCIGKIVRWNAAKWGYLSRVIQKLKYWYFNGAPVKKNARAKWKSSPFLYNIDSLPVERLCGNPSDCCSLQSDIIIISRV